MTNTTSKSVTSQLAKSASKYEQFSSEEKLTWCTGCGNFGIQNALKRALTLENISIRDTLLVFDIGCNGNGADKIHAYTLHGLHGRTISVAAGAALANPKLKVIGIAGDGATFSEGVNHLVHAIRSNYPMLFIMHNNNNYGLTTGQASSTTKKGVPMNGTPDGVYLDPLNPLEMILSLNPTFVARSFSGDVKHMTEMLRAGLNHRGFACVEIMQTCPTYNKATPQEWYWERVKNLADDPHYDRSNIWAARKAAEDLNDRISVGVLYERQAPNFLELLPNRKDARTTLVEEVKSYDISKLLEQFE